VSERAGEQASEQTKLPVLTTGGGELAWLNWKSNRLSYCVRHLVPAIWLGVGWMAANRWGLSGLAAWSGLALTG
jgi:hypothetical protein